MSIKMEYTPESELAQHHRAAMKNAVSRQSLELLLGTITTALDCVDGGVHQVALLRDAETTLKNMAKQVSLTRNALVRGRREIDDDARVLATIRRERAELVAKVKTRPLA